MLYLCLLYSIINIIGFLMLFEYEPSKEEKNESGNNDDL